jgi:hypothetical protein
MEFVGSFQELMKFEQGTLVCTWMVVQLMKGVWNSNLCDVLDLLQEVDSNLFKFGFGLFRVWLNQSINA